MKFLGAHFSYNGTLKVQNSFLGTVKSIQQMLHFWGSRMFSLEGTLIILKRLAVSKIVYLTFLTVIPNSLIEKLQKIHGTGGPKHVDISSKMFSLHCPWLRKLCDKINSFSPYKQILRKII